MSFTTRIFIVAAVLAGIALFEQGTSPQSAMATGRDPGATGSVNEASLATGYPRLGFNWQTVVNNGFYIPKTKKLYNSYNQPSVSADGTVVFRARGKGHPRATGIYVRQAGGNEVRSFVDLLTEVPYPNNLGTQFNEFPSIPRISIQRGLVATRGNHEPVYTYELPDGSETRAGTSGIYAIFDGQFAVTGASKLGGVPGFEHFAVPGTDPPVNFDVFPGSPSITDDGTIVFKGNYTDNGVPKTGAFFRQLLNTPGGGYEPPEAIATSDTEIPGIPPHAGFKEVTFGSVAPPTAVGDRAVFVALDNEDDPHFGGLYLARLKANSELHPVAEIGKGILGTKAYEISRIGEAVSFDGRYVAFWAAWGRESRTVRLNCVEEGNADRRAFCSGGDPNSVFDKETGKWFQEKQVPARQGIFVYDTLSGTYYTVATTDDFSDFTYWGYTGMVPGVGDDDSDGEPPRWRSGSFLSVYDGKVAFKARTGYLDKKNTYFDPVDGIYFVNAPAYSGIAAIVETGMDGGMLDPSMPAGLRAGMPITEIAIEREGLRGRYLAISAKMGTEEDGWGGVYRADIFSTPPENVSEKSRILNAAKKERLR